MKEVRSKFVISAVENTKQKLKVDALQIICTSGSDTMSNNAVSRKMSTIDSDVHIHVLSGFRNPVRTQIHHLFIKQ